jgi:hypothetical protein
MRLILIPFQNQKDREGEPQTVHSVRLGDADKKIFDSGMETPQGGVTWCG